MANRRDREDRSRGRSAARSDRIEIPHRPFSIFGLDPKPETSQTFHQSPEISSSNRQRTKPSLPSGRRSTSRHIPTFRRASSSPPSTSPSDTADPRAFSQDRRSPTFGGISTSPISTRFPSRDRSDTPIVDSHYRTPGGWEDHSTPPDKSRPSAKTKTNGPGAAAVKSRDVKVSESGDVKVPKSSDDKVTKSSDNRARSNAIVWLLLMLLLPSVALNCLLSWAVIGADARCMITGQCKTVQLPDAAIAANVTGSRPSMCAKFGEAMRTSKELEQSWELIVDQAKQCPGSLLVHPLVRDALNQTCNLRCATELNFAGAVPGDTAIHPGVFEELAPVKWSWPWWRKLFVLAIQHMMGGDGSWLQEGYFNMNSSSSSGIGGLYQRSISTIGVRLQPFVRNDSVVRWAVEFDAAAEQALNGTEAGFYLDAVWSLYRMEGNGRDVGALGELLVKDPDAGYLAGYRVTPPCTPHTLAMRVQTVGYEAQAAAWAALEAVRWWETGTRILPVSKADGPRPRGGMRSGAMQLVRASVEQPEVTREWMRNQELRLAHRMGKDMCPLVPEADSVCSREQGCDIGGGRR